MTMWEIAWYIVSWLTYYVPWWGWAVVGLGGGAALYFLIPRVVPEDARVFAAMSAACVGICFSCTAWGQLNGVAMERVRWEKLQEMEIVRIQNELSFEKIEETNRRVKAEQEVKSLKETLSELDREADEEVDAGRVCVSEHIARRLHDLRRRSH